MKSILKKTEVVTLYALVWLDEAHTIIYYSTLTYTHTTHTLSHNTHTPHSHTHTTHTLTHTHTHTLNSNPFPVRYEKNVAKVCFQKSNMESILKEDRG